MNRKEENLVSHEEAKRQNEIILRLKDRLKGQNLTYFITTFGCAMNGRDSEKLKGILEQIGYVEAETELLADFVVYNTCAVRENAENRVYGRIGHLKTAKGKNPSMIIALCGCMMQQPTVISELKSKHKHIDIVFGTHNLYKIAELLEIRLETKHSVYDIWENHREIIEDLPSIRKYKYKASVNIVYGCNNFCTYCIVPYVRGRERSRLPEDIIHEIEALVADGVLEITLLGQNVNSYGTTLDQPMSFAKLLQRIEKIEGLKRLRFMTAHPKDLSDELIDVMSQSEVICNHVHLPFQSGSTKILKSMNRKYTKESYMALIGRIKAKVKDVVLTTDIIVGFPGEDDQDIEDTIEVIRYGEFSTAYTFIYSKRTGTPAANMENQVPEEVTKVRFNKILDAVSDMAHKNTSKHVGNVYDVLVEEVNAKNPEMVTGRLRDSTLVHLIGDEGLLGKIVDVKIISNKTHYVVGELV